MPISLLIVDDSPIIRRVLIRALHMALAGIDRISEAANGVEALAILENDPIDLILTDINMDDMGGIELISHVKASEHLRDIPIVVISTEGNENRVAQLLAEGAVGYIKKPFTPEQIKDTISGIVGGSDE